MGATFSHFCWHILTKHILRHDSTQIPLVIGPRKQTNPQLPPDPNHLTDSTQIPLVIGPRKQINPQLPPDPNHLTEISIPHLPLDLWYEVFGLLDIDEAIAVSKASPRIFGAFIESKQGIRFRNAINSYMHSNALDFPVGLFDLPVGPLSSFVCSVSRWSSLDFDSLFSWLAIRFHPVLSSSIVVGISNLKTFLRLSFLKMDLLIFLIV
jgi:hypothetical protein